MKLEPLSADFVNMFPEISSQVDWTSQEKVVEILFVQNWQIVNSTHNAYGVRKGM